VVKSNDYKEKQCFTIQITDIGINIFDRNYTLQASYNNSNIKSIVFSDDFYMYCLCGAVSDPIVKIDGPDGTDVTFKEFTETSGFFVYDLSRLVRSEKFEIYKLRSALVGINTLLTYSQFNQRMSFLKDFNTIQILPFMHRNTINFLGMSGREDYLIWREKGGFFTALNQKDGTIQTWSVASGKLLYSYKECFKPLEGDLNNYVIYEAPAADEEHRDVSQLMNFYNFNHKSISLIRKKTCEAKTQDVAHSAAGSLFRKNDSRGSSVVLGSDEKIDGTFNFKVLQLETIQDFKEKAAVGWRNAVDQVTELFNFDHKISIPRKEAGKSFHSNEVQQRLYLSKNTKRMMEVFDNQLAVVYERTDVKAGSKIEWKPVASIEQFPTVLQGLTSANFLFSPNFDWFFDIDYSEQQFLIRKVHYSNENAELPNEYFLPKDIVSLKGFEEKHPKDTVKYLASRMMFVTDKLIRVITFGGMDCLFDISHKPSNSNKADLRLVTYTKLDNYQTGNFNVENHAILEKLPLPLDEVFERLMRKTHS